MGYRTARSIPDEEIVRIALSLDWGMNSFSDLVSAVRQELHVSGNVAAKAVNRVLDRRLIHQVHKNEWLPVPRSSMTTGNGFNVKTNLSKWETNNDGCSETV